MLEHSVPVLTTTRRFAVNNSYVCAKGINNCRRSFYVVFSRGASLFDKILL